MTDDTIAEFHAAMLGPYDAAAKLSPPYNAHAYRRMVNEHRGKETADKLLATTEPSSGFSELFLRGRDKLSLSVEYLVLQHAWRGLFTDAQLAVARRRLEDVGCQLPPE
jgi:hypothetical protein